MGTSCKKFDYSYFHDVRVTCCMFVSEGIFFQMSAFYIQRARRLKVFFHYRQDLAMLSSF